MSYYEQIVIGIDQSYSNTGISVSADGKLLDVKSIHLDKLKSNTQRRQTIRRRLNVLLKRCINKASSIICIVERTRIHGGETSFINVHAIKAMGALTAVIVDQCAIYGVPVFSVDTRTWKSTVIGTCRPKENKFGVPPQKWPTIQWLCKLGYEDKILIDLSNTKRTKGTFVRGGKRYQYNNDAADSAGICMYWWSGDRKKLQQEK